MRKKYNCGFKISWHNSKEDYDKYGEKKSFHQKSIFRIFHII